jgi:hypothetical protein
MRFHGFVQKLRYIHTVGSWFGGDANAGHLMPAMIYLFHVPFKFQRWYPATYRVKPSSINKGYFYQGFDLADG